MNRSLIKLSGFTHKENGEYVGRVNFSFEGWKNTNIANIVFGKEQKISCKIYVENTFSGQTMDETYLIHELELNEFLKENTESFISSINCFNLLLKKDIKSIFNELYDESFKEFSNCIAIDFKVKGIESNFRYIIVKDSIKKDTIESIFSVNAHYINSSFIKMFDNYFLNKSKYRLLLLYGSLEKTNTETESNK